MIAFTSIILVILLLISLLFTKDIFHPSTIVSGLWALLFNMYVFLEHPLWSLSDNFCKAILLWVTPFVLFSCIFSSRSIRLATPIEAYEVNIDRYNKIFPYIIIYCIIFLCTIVLLSGGMSFHNIRQLMLGDIPAPISILLYLNTFMTIYVLYGVANIEHFSKKKIYFLILLLLIISIFKSNKTSFLAIFVSLVYLLKKKGNFKLKYVLLLILGLFLLLYIVSINRSDYDFEKEDGLINYMYIYILSPLTAFDSLINDEVTLNSGTFGESVFEMFYKILNIFGFDLKVSELGVWVNVPLPTNVFTVMRGPFLDGGYLGISVISSILGIIWGILYSLQNGKYPIFILFYASMISSLFFQSFGDYFFHSLSMTIQYYVFSVILVRGVKFDIRTVKKKNY